MSVAESPAAHSVGASSVARDASTFAASPYPADMTAGRYRRFRCLHELTVELEELHRRHLAPVMIEMTGHTGMKSVQRLEAFPLVGFLEKPFSVVVQLRALLARWRKAT